MSTSHKVAVDMSLLIGSGRLDDQSSSSLYESDWRDAPDRQEKSDRRRERRDARNLKQLGKK